MKQMRQQFFVRSFPRRAIRSQDTPSTYERVEDRLAAVLTVFTDGTKAPLTILGTAHRQIWFPRHFDPMNNVGKFYQSQANAWNNGQLWTQTVGGSKRALEPEGRTIATLMNNCLAHAIN